MEASSCKECGKPVAEGVELCWNCRPSVAPLQVEPTGVKKRRLTRPVTRTPMTTEEKLKEERKAKDPRYSRRKTLFGKAIMNQAKFDDKMLETFLQELALTGQKAHSARVAGISPPRFYAMQTESEELQALCDAAMEFYRDHLHNEIEKMALQGYEVEEFSKDGQLRRRIVRSEKMMELLARIHFPQLARGSQQNVAIGVKMPKIEVNIVGGTGEDLPKVEDFEARRQVGKDEDDVE